MAGGRYMLRNTIYIVIILVFEFWIYLSLFIVFSIPWGIILNILTLIKYLLIIWKTMFLIICGLIITLFTGFKIIEY